MNKDLEVNSNSIRCVWLCYTAMICLAIAINLPPVYLTTFRETFGSSGGLTAEQLGRIAACIFAGVVTGILITGPLADRFGAKPFVMIGTALIGLGLAATATAKSYEILLMAMFVMGLGGGALEMILSPIVCALEPHRRVSAMNWLHSFFCIGAVLAVTTGSLAIRAEISWRLVASTIIVLPVITFVGFALVKVPILIAKDNKRTTVPTLMKNGYFLAALLLIMLAGGTELGIAQWLPAYAEKSLGYTRWISSMSLMAFSITMGVGRIASGVICQRISAVSLMLICCTLSVVLIIIGCFIPVSSVAMGACIFVGLAVACLWPGILGIAGDRFPNGGASMFGLLAAFGCLGGILLPWLVGVIADMSSLNWGLASAGLCPPVIVVILLYMNSESKYMSATRGI